MAYLLPRILNSRKLLFFFISQCYYPFLVGSFLKNLKFEVSIQLPGEVVLSGGNKFLFSYLSWVGLTCVPSPAGSQDNDWLHSRFF